MTSPDVDRGLSLQDAGVQADLDLLGGFVLHLEEGGPLTVGDPAALAACLRRVLSTAYPGDAAETVPHSVYLSAVKGRAAFRDALREARARPLGMMTDDVTEALTTLCEWFGQREAGKPTTNSEAAMFARIDQVLSRYEALEARPLPEGLGEAEKVWRVCHVITGDCERCPETTMVRGDPCVRGCYLLAVEAINVVETGNPWRKSTGVKEPWIAALSDGAKRPTGSEAQRSTGTNKEPPLSNGGRDG